MFITAESWGLCVGNGFGIYWNKALIRLNLLIWTPLSEILDLMYSLYI